MAEVIVWTPSENENAVGVSDVSGMFAPQGGRERHEASHLVTGGVWPTHRCEWIPGVVVRNGGGLDGGGRKSADGATEADNFAESSGFHIIIFYLSKLTGHPTIFWLPSETRGSRQAGLRRETASPVNHNFDNFPESYYSDCKKRCLT